MVSIAQSIVSYKFLDFSLGGCSRLDRMSHVIIAKDPGFAHVEQTFFHHNLSGVWLLNSYTVKGVATNKQLCYEKNVSIQYPIPLYAIPSEGLWSHGVGRRVIVEITLFPILKKNYFFWKKIKLKLSIFDNARFIIYCITQFNHVNKTT